MKIKNRFVSWIIYFVITLLISYILTFAAAVSGLLDAIVKFFHNYLVLIGFNYIWWLIPLIIFNIFIFKFKVSWIGDYKRAIIMVLPVIAYVVFSIISRGVIFNLDALVVLFGTLIIGFTEEYVFRGTLINSLEKVFKNKWTIAIISSSIFAVSHIQNLFLGSQPISVLYQIIFTFFYGLLNAAIYMKTKSLFVIAIAHALFDWSSLTAAHDYFSLGLVFNSVGIGLIFGIFAVWYLVKFVKDVK